MTKRDDLQWLRALAIIAVVSFHLQPKIFPFGYLGVDIFFVISGYLMTSILSKSPDTLTFYLRRIKRIFPVYFLTITIFFVIGYLKLLPSHFDFLKAEVLWSIFFVNNFPPMLEKKEYFQMISEFKFFLHTWSLSVEIQFYLMAPFLIKFILSRNHSMFWTFTFIGFSCLLQTVIQNNEVAFGLVFCRIWQFLIGTFAFLYANQKYSDYVIISDCDTNYEPFEFGDDIALVEEDLKPAVMVTVISHDNNVKENVSNDSHNRIENICIIFVVFIALILICFNTYNFLPVKLEAYVFRLLATVLTGIFISFNSKLFFIRSLINSVFVYIGDISYIIYLVHWPVIIYFKYFHITFGDFFTLVCIFAATLLIHECFEKLFAKLSWKWYIVFFAVSYIFLVFMLFAENNSFPDKFYYIHGNQEESKSCSKFYYDSCEASPIIDKYYTFKRTASPLDHYCSFKLNPAANKNILITGNSFVYFQIRGILEGITQAKTKFSEAFVISRPGCNILVGALNAKYNYCAGYETSHDEILPVIKPDIIIITTRIDYFFPTDNASNINYKNDTYYETVKSQILHIASFTRRLIIIEPHPIYSNDNNINPMNIARDIFINSTRSHFSISTEEFHKRHDPSWNRVKEAAKYCKNCVIVPTQQIMCPGDTCPIVDPITKLSLFCDGSHMTPRQSLKFIPSIIKAIDEYVPIFDTS